MVSKSPLIFFFLLSSTIAENIFPSSPICHAIPHHHLCRSSSIHHKNHPTNIYNNGRLSIINSIAATHKFISLIEKYLHQSSTLTPGALFALQDCHALVDINLDFLTTSLHAINKTTTLSLTRADDVQTLLSAILSNTQTCVDGLKELASSWFHLNNDISKLVSKDIKLYSLALDLFIKGWLPDSNNLRPENNSVSNGDMLNWKMLANVTVSQDGTRNFTTVSDAVAAAPEHAEATAGYFVIYVTAGVYEEYVSIGKKKQYVMIVGDGINQTVLTGNHSVDDGWSTFNSSTFGQTS